MKLINSITHKIHNIPLCGLTTEDLLNNKEWVHVDTYTKTLTELVEDVNSICSTVMLASIIDKVIENLGYIIIDTEHKYLSTNFVLFYRALIKKYNIDKVKEHCKIIKLSKESYKNLITTLHE